MNKVKVGTVPVPDVPKFLQIDKTFRIAVTGDVLVTELEKEIIDTPDFQRLRGVRQLGSVNLVYPTALHTRFDHSLGTLAMADKMIRAIRDNTHSTAAEKAIDSTQEALTRLYALLHDLTHIPFGHTLEDELELFERHDKNKARIERFFGPASAVGSLIIDKLGEETYKRFRAIYQWEGGSDDGETEERRAIVKSIRDNDDAFIYDIVSNTVCADLLDYLMRDSYFCNLVLGLDYRFLNFLYLREDDGVRRVFIRLWKQGHAEPRRDTLTDLVRLLEARYIVAERAYFHHAKIISGAMLGRAIQEASLAEDNRLTEEQIYSFSDDILVHELRSSRNPVATRLAQNFAERKLYKRVITFTREDFAGVQGHDHDQNALDNALALVSSPTRRKELEDRLAGEIDAESGEILIYAPDKRMNLKAAKMKVLWEGKPKELKDIDDPVVAPKLKAILESHRMLWAIHVIAKPGLTEQQYGLLKKSCKVKFLCHPVQRKAEEQELNENLIECRLRKLKLNIPTNPVLFDERRAQAASRLSNLYGVSSPLACCARLNE